MAVVDAPADAAPAPPRGDRIAAWLFLRLLGLTYLFAFASLWVQVDGLIGSRGILPAAELLAAARAELGSDAPWHEPTLLWLGASDAALHLLAGGGTVLAALVVLDLATLPALALLWAFYLSLTVAGQEFLSFQWDVLLLETGFLAVLLAPLRLLPRRPAGDAPPSPWAVWMLRWLLFRLMFSSGVVKLASGDATWRDLSALTVHYETQPLPTWAGWLAHQPPAWWHTLSCVLMFAVELVVPFLVFAPRRARAAAALLFVGLEAVIAVTGNYGYFNLLTAALAVLLIHDALWPRALRERLLAPEARTRPPARAWPVWVAAPVAAALAVASLVPLLRLVGVAAPRPLALAYHRVVAPLRLVNGYGLFAVMTTRRDEIVLEGSRDGREWRTYAFRWKPGDAGARPRFVAPHMPRLDWQMWFAALAPYRASPWFLRFAARLVAGEPAVTHLLADDPFAGAPPRYLRTTLWTYRFTDVPTWRATGTWWQREEKGPWAPVLRAPGAPPLPAPARAPDSAATDAP